MYQITEEEIRSLKSAQVGLRPSELAAQENVNKHITGEMSRDFYLGFASALKMVSETTSDRSQLLTIGVLMKRVVTFL